MNACKLPPEGWACTREAGHEGPCAAVRNDIRFTIHQDDKRLVIHNIDLDMDIFIDYDDVWHEDVMHKAEQLCDILNQHWPRS